MQERDVIIGVVDSLWKAKRTSNQKSNLTDSDEEKKITDNKCAFKQCYNTADHYIGFTSGRKEIYCYTHAEGFWAQADPLYKIFLEKMENLKNENSSSLKPPAIPF